jgi:hypothetical protein
MKHWFSVVLALAAVSGACGDDETAADSGEGCTTDAQCKGDRICVDRQCVDPGEGGGVQSGNGGSAAGQSGTAAAGQGGSSSGSGGSGGSSGLGGAAGGGVIDDPELENACIKNCQARQNAACSMNIGSLDQCMGQCLVIDEQSYGYCLDEQTAQYACLASGGYTCVSGYPQPKSTCVTESQALSSCSQKIPCRRFCARAAGQCAPEGDACVTACIAEQSSFADAICGVYYSQLLSCWGMSLTCDGDAPAVAPCGPYVAEVADCIGRRNHECDGICWAAERLGCGSDSCVTSCREKADATSCGSYYRSYLDCAFSSNALQLECVDGAPVPTAACASQQQQYTSCMASQSQ